MKLSRAVGVACLGMFLAVLFGPTQHASLHSQNKQKRTRAIDLIGEAEKELTHLGKLDDRRRAIDDLVDVSAHLSNTVVVLMGWGLKDPDPEIRDKAMKALANIGPSARFAESSLLETLQKGKVAHDRVEAASALSAIFRDSGALRSHRAIVAVLAKAMRDDTDTAVRYTACGALRNIGPGATDAAADLLHVVNNTEDHFMRKLARGSFITVVGPRNKGLTPLLLDMHKNGIEDESLEAVVILALGKIGANENVVVPLLIEILKRKNPKHARSREAAAEALGEMGPIAKDAVPVLIDAFEESLKLKENDPRNVWPSAPCALEEIGPDAEMAIPAIRRFVDDPRTEASNRLAARLALKAIDKNYKE